MNIAAMKIAAIAIVATLGLVTALVGVVQAQSNRVYCDGVTEPNTYSSECIGYNPYYVPPGSSEPLGLPKGTFGTPEYNASIAAVKRRLEGGSAGVAREAAPGGSAGLRPPAPGGRPRTPAPPRS